MMFGIIAAAIFSIGLTSTQINAQEQLKEVTHQRVDLLEKHQTENLPWLESSMVNSVQTLKKDNTVTFEVTLHNGDPGSYVILEPTTSRGGIVVDTTLDKETVFQRANDRLDGKEVSGILFYSDVVSFNTDRIRLESGQSVTFEANVNLTDEMKRIFDDSEFTANIIFNVVESSGIDKLPKDQAQLELRGVNFG
jgi:hypothetical protein